MKLLSDLINFLQQHEAVLVVVSAWITREFTRAVPGIKWIWSSGLGVRGVFKRFFLGVPPIQPPNQNP